MKSPLKNPPPRTAGQGLEDHRQELISNGLELICFVPAILWFATMMEFFGQWRGAPRMPWLYASMALASTAYGTFGFFRLRRKNRNLKLGRDGEREVGYILSTIDLPGARIFHDIPAEGFNLDHVVVCDRGIYVIETKTWRKPENAETKLTVHEGYINRDGKRTRKPVQQAMGEARWLAGRLRKMTGREFDCQPVVVTPGWFVQEPMDSGTRAMAWVLNPTRLLGYIHQTPSRLRPEDVNLVADRIGVLVRQERKP